MTVFASAGPHFFLGAIPSSVDCPTLGFDSYKGNKFLKAGEDLKDLLQYTFEDTQLFKLKDILKAFDDASSEMPFNFEANNFQGQRCKTRKQTWLD